MSDQSLDFLQSEAADDSYDKKEDSWAYFSAPKDLTIAKDDLEESPRGVVDRCITSVEGVIPKPEAADINTTTNTTGEEASASNLHESSRSNHNKSEGRSPRSRKDKVKPSTMDNSSDTAGMEEAAPLNNNSRRGDMDDSRRQRRSHAAMDDSRSNRRRSDKDMDDSSGRRRKSDRDMDDSQAGKNPTRTRRPTTEGRRRTSGPTRNLDSRIQGDSASRIPAGSQSQRSMDGSVPGGRERSPNQKRSSKTRLRIAGSSGRNVHSSGDSVQSGHSGAGSRDGDGERRPRRAKRRETGEDGEAAGPSARLKRAGTRKEAEDGEAGPSARLKRTGTRTRRPEGSRTRAENGKKMGDSSDRDRRMSDNSKNRDRRERKEGRRNSEEMGRDRRMSDGSRREGRRSGTLDESSRRRRPREKRDGDTRRKRRERVLRNKDTHIPPPSQGGEGDEAADVSPTRSSAGPSDQVPGHRRSSRQKKHSPMDMPPMLEESEDEEEQVFETTWKRSAPTHRPRHRRSVVGEAAGISPRQEGRRSVVATPHQAANSPATSGRRPGRDRRGANVRQTQLVNMVLLHEDEESDGPTTESEREKEELPGLLEQEEGEEEEAHIDFSASEHHKHTSVTSNALKAAVKASSAVTKVGAKFTGKAAQVGTKAAVSGAKGAGKASVAAAKGAGKAVKGVLGFGKKKKPLAYSEGNNSEAGLCFEEPHDELDVLAGWDGEEEMDGSGGTNLHGSGATSLHD